MKYGFKALVLIASAIMATGCTSTRGAYQVAESPDEYAFVVAEHYNALVNEAADLAQQPGTPQQVRTALKRADAKAKPLVVQLRGLAANYAAVKDAQSQAVLQEALNKAVLAIADFIRELRKAQASPTGMTVWGPVADRLLAAAGGAT